MMCSLSVVLCRKSGLEYENANHQLLQATSAETWHMGIYKVINQNLGGEFVKIVKIMKCILVPSY